MLLIVILVAFCGITAAAENEEEKDGKDEIYDNITTLLEGLDLSELQKYLDENGDSYLLNFGSTAKDIVEYLI